MPIYYNNERLSDIYNGRSNAMAGFYNGNVVFDKTVNVKFIGTSEGTNIWGTDAAISGYAGTQSSAFVFDTPQKKGPYTFQFNWSGEAYVTAYGFQVIVTYTDDTTEVLYSGNLDGYYSGGSGTARYNFTMQKPWKRIEVQIWRSIITTIYCYSGLGSVRIYSKGSYLALYEQE